MGVTIHYQGKIKNKALLPELVAEVKDIALSMEWKHHVYSQIFPPENTDDESYDGQLYGITFSPPNCEPVWITFLSNGRMSGPLFLAFRSDENPKGESEYLYNLFTKTQFAGVAIHKSVIELLRYLNGKGYFAEFRVIDEGEYWVTRDEALLEANLGRVGRAIDDLSLALQVVPPVEGEELEDYFMRLMDLINTRNNRNKNNNFS